jgi:RNA polymerase sigma-70 factor, ECF subfamily
MSTLSADLIREFPYPATEEVEYSANPSEIECEVIGLYDQFRDPLLRYVLSFGLPIHDGEEVIQEVFLALFRHLREGKSRRNLPGWLFSVGHNLALKQRHENQRCQDRLAPDVEVVQTQVDPSPDPEALLLSAQRQKRLLSAFHALPEQDQCCLRLRAEGLRYREIARVLGISLGSVSGSLARSLARLIRLDRR